MERVNFGFILDQKNCKKLNHFDAHKIHMYITQHCHTNVLDMHEECYCSSNLKKSCISRKFDPLIAN